MVNFARALCLGADVLKGPNQKPFQGELNYDAMVWLDSDMAFNPETMDKLIQRCLNDKPVVSELILWMVENHYVVLKIGIKNITKSMVHFNSFLSKIVKERMNINEDTKELDENKDVVVDAAYVGMGYMAIRKRCN